MTLRRLSVLLRSLPAEAALWAELIAAEEKAQKPTVDRIRERQQHYDRQRAKAEMTTTQRLEHDMSIAGHEPDCPICQQRAKGA